MECLKKEIHDYWTDRAEGYSKYNRQEMADERRSMWKRKLIALLENRFLPNKPSEIKILDVGTGPGFFAILLAEAGYQVTALDATEQMLREARRNAGELAKQIHWKTGDAEKLDFAEASFDAVVSRNVTWNLRYPAKAYKEWYRVLKPGGVLLNFDADWYGYLYDEEKRRGYEQDRRAVALNRKLEDYYLGTDINRMERIARKVPLSGLQRPEWDMDAIKKAGFEHAQCDREVWKQVWNEEEITNNSSTPLFLLTGEKRKKTLRSGPMIVCEQSAASHDERKDRIIRYWNGRSENFLEQRRAELHNPMAKRWMKEIQSRIPQGRSLKILDAGCGAGFFSILLAKEGHQVTGIDLTPAMIKNAETLAQEEGVCCTLRVMDAENPDFPDESFDVVLSRNLTWTLPHVRQAYQEWVRVLKHGGVLLNFDANYGASDCRDKQGLPEQHSHHMLGDEMLRECEEIKRQLPINFCSRPAWDLETLGSIKGLEQFQIDLGISGRIYIEKDEFYNPVPMFMIRTRKQ